MKRRRPRYYQSLCLLAAILVCLFLFVESAYATDSKALFQEALICYGEIDFECTLSKLLQAKDIEGSGPGNRELLIEIYRYMAYSQVALGKTSQAKESLRRILLISPEFQMEASEVSPKIFRLYNEVKVELEQIKQQSVTQPAEKKEPEQKPKPTPPPIKEKKPEPKPKAPVPVWSVGAEGTVVFPLGEDTDYYNIGFSIGGVFEARVIDNVSMGGVLFYQRLGGKEDLSDLHLLAAAYRAAYTFDFKLIALKLPLDIGFATYGRGAVADEQGLLLRLLPGISINPMPNMALGVMVGPGSVMIFDRMAASWFIQAGMTIGGRF